MHLCFTMNYMDKDGLSGHHIFQNGLKLSPECGIIYLSQAKRENDDERHKGNRYLHNTPLHHTKQQMGRPRAEAASLSCPLRRRAWPTHFLSDGRVLVASENTVHFLNRNDRTELRFSVSDTRSSPRLSPTTRRTHSLSTAQATTR